MSPSPAAPRIASMSAWTTTSPSECPASPRGCSSSTPPSTSGTPSASACASTPIPTRYSGIEPACHSLEIFGRRHLEQPLVAEHDRDAPAGGLDERGAVGRLRRAVSGCECASQGGRGEGLGCLYGDELVARRCLDDDSVADPLDGVGDRQTGYGALVAAVQGAEQAFHEPGRKQRAGCVMDEHDGGVSRHLREARPYRVGARVAARHAGG